MKNHRTLSRILLTLFILTGFLIYKELEDWRYLTFLHFFAGGIAYQLGLSNRPHHKTDLIEVCMMLLAICAGYISLFTTSFIEVEGHEEGNFHLW